LKNNIEFYQHFVTSDQHPKFKMLRVKLGWAGEGRFWALNNRIGQSDNCCLDLSKKYNKASLASDLDLNLDDLDEFLDFLLDDCELIKEVEKNVITTDIIQENYDKVSSNRNRSRERKQKFDDKISNNLKNTDKFPVNSNNSGKVLKSFKKFDKLSNKSCVKSESSPELYNKAKQSKVNQSKEKNSRQQSAFEPEGNTRASPDFAAADFLSSDVLKSRCKDSTGLILKPPEIAIILNSLKAQNLGEAFLEFLFARIRKNSDVNKPAGFLKHLLLNLGDFEDYVGDFRKIKNKPHVPKRPEIPKCFCKGEIRDGGDVCQCSNCGAMWELVDNSWRTVPKAEIPDISGIFKKKSAFQPESKAI